MTQQFIESNSKVPQFFGFSQIFNEYDDHNLLINSIQEDFDKWQEENWLKYWNKEGEHIVLEAWNEKYKDYLKEGEEHNDKKDLQLETTKEDIIEESGESKTEIISTDNEVAQEEYSQSWNELWEQHREEIYFEQYLLYTTILYNYFLELKNSLEQILPIEEAIEEEEEEEDNNKYSLNEYNNLSEELEQLKLLGLPTAFGGRPQNSSKKAKKLHKSLHFSDFFSESDIDNTSSESEMDDISTSTLPPLQEEETDAVSLHATENNAIRKATQKTQKKKKNRKLKNIPSFLIEEKGMLKYWRKRFSLFSRFDEGIRLDRESWFSVTPEKVAKHLAERLQTSILVDGFCGSGGNAIQFALTCDRVIAIDIDPLKLEMAKHNAKIYNVSHKIEFICGDFLQLANTGKLKGDIVFLSPPWGGPKYKNKKDYDIEKYLLPVKASELVDAARHISTNVALFLPRNSNLKQIIKLAGIGNRCEIEHSYLDSRLVAITALYGEDILKNKSSET
ncbi:trimethylguanosine synthase [Musca vetustissima]|uniref:trimethylguanosine synthase n=1 Tax=Musca vetustissima TaxID=27455 RepID=UPI002AB6BBBD|nr:trimethylguanosine synthase [Musca vetustissima]